MPSSDDSVWRWMTIGLLAGLLLLAAALGVIGAVAVAHETAIHGAAVCTLRDTLVKLVRSGIHQLSAISYYKVHPNELRVVVQEQYHTIHVLQALSCQ